MKSQAKIAFDKASKSHDLMKRVSILEDEVSSLVAKITHFDECDSFLVGIVESVCEMLLCKLP
jgi:DNA-binding Xre family transcriptional regulator